MIHESLSISWSGHCPLIQTERLVLRPVEPADLPKYQALFASKVAMQKYVGGPRDPAATATRFNGWVERWKIHPFSALAIFLKQTDKVAQQFVGHVVLGHGDFEGDPNHGWSEAAIIIDPKYWNAAYAASNEGVGAAGLKGIGKEAVEAVAFYAQALYEKGVKVPVDVTKEQQAGVKKLIDSGVIDNCLKDENGQIKSVFIPFKEVRATSHKANTAIMKIQQSYKNQTLPKPGDPSRELFILNLEILVGKK